MAQKISQMTEQTTSSMTEAGTSDFLGGYTTTGGNAKRKFSLSGLANYFLNKFKMTLGGSSQTVKSAIDALNSKTQVANIPLNQSVTVSLGQDTLYLLVTAKPLGTDIASSLHIIYSSQYGSTLTEIYKRTNVAVSVDKLTLTISTDTQYVSYALIALK